MANFKHLHTCTKWGAEKLLAKRTFQNLAKYQIFLFNLFWLEQEFFFYMFVVLLCVLQELFSTPYVYDIL